MSTPAEVGHLLQGAVSELPLKEFVDVGRQEVTDLARKTGRHTPDGLVG